MEKDKNKEKEQLTGSSSSSKSSRSKRERKAKPSKMATALGWFRELNRTARTLVACAIALAIAGALWLLVQGASSIFNNRPGEMITTLRSSLEKIENSSSLSTLEYTYNSIVPVYSDEEQTIERYFVRYEGKVTMGINLEDVEISLSTEDPDTIVVTVPQVTIQDTAVDPGSLEYIFRDPAAMTETVNVEAYQLCEKQLEQAADQDESLKNIAAENVMNELKALTHPVSAQLTGNVKVVYEWAE